MKPRYLVEGDLVVVNQAPDATLYVVLEVDHNHVFVNEAGTNNRGQWFDYSIFQKPSKAQLGG